MIYLNGKELFNLHVEDKEIQRVLLEDKLIWENVKCIKLGTGQTFDVTSKYSKYNELTADNFFFTLSTSQAKITGNVPSGIVYCSDALEKTYNPSTGALIMRTKVYSGSNIAYGNVTAYLVTNPQKLIYLGEGQSFDVKRYSGYENFTADNFLIQNATGGSIGGIRDPLGFSATCDLVKSYSNGTLSCYLFGEFLSSKPHTETWSSSRKDSCKVYLIKKGVS